MTDPCVYDSDVSGSDCIEECLSQGCILALLGNTACDPGTHYSVCNLEVCGWDKGDCGVCQPGCRRHTGFRAMIGNGQCESQCDFAVCNFDGGDCVTIEKPVKVYVADMQGAGGTGTSESPYTALSQALAEVWAPYTLISLLKGAHRLDSSPSTQVAKFVTISTVICSEEAHPLCSDSASTLQVTANSSTLLVASSLTIRNVIFLGNFSLSPLCDSDFCKYCPFTWRDAEGTLRGDRNDTLGAHADQSLCDQFQHFSLISITPGGVLRLYDVAFVEIRHQPKAVISSDCGIVELKNVTFSRVTPRRNGLIGGVVTAVNSRSGHCGSFSFHKGLVEYLNDGYEFVPGDAFSGFAWLSGLIRIDISEVRFQYNNLLTKNLLPSALLYLQGFSQMAVTKCVFAHTIATAGVIQVNSTFGDFLDNVTISVSDSAFMYNYGSLHAGVYILYGLGEYRTSIANCTFTRNVAVSVGLVTIVKPDGTTSYLGRRLATENHDSVSIQGLSFTENQGPYLTYMHNLDSVDIIDTVYDGNTALPSLLYEVLTAFVDGPGTYMSVVPEVLPAMCQFTVYLKDIAHATVRGVTVKDCNCTHGSPGIVVFGVSQSVFITQISIISVSFLRNEGSTLLWLELHCDVILSHLTFINNTNFASNESVCIFLSPNSEVNATIEFSLFQHNKAVHNTIANISGIQSFTLREVVVERNSALKSCAGLAFTPAEGRFTRLTLTNSTFRSNFALSSGALSIYDSSGEQISPQAGKLTVLISGSVFEQNTAQVDGSGISLSGLVGLTAESQITNSRFIANECPEGGAGIKIRFLVGFLLLKSCEFTANRGLNGAAIWTNHKGTGTSLKMQNCSLTANSGDSSIETTEEKTSLMTEHCLFVQASSTAMIISSGSWVDNGSLFRENIGGDAGAFVISIHGSGLLLNTRFIRNQGLLDGGAGSLYHHTNLTCIDCLFEDNVSGGRGGALLMDTDSECIVKHGVFVRNIAGHGSVIFASYSSIVCHDCTISRNEARNFGSIVLIHSSLDMSNSTVEGNTSPLRSPGIQATMSHVSIANCSFSNHSGDTGSFLLAMEFSSVVITASTFRSCFAHKYGGSFYIAEDSEFTLRDSSVTECAVNKEGGVLMSKSSTVVLERVSISHASSPLQSGIVVVNDGFGSIECDFTDITGSALEATGSSLDVHNSSFQRIASSYGAALQCLECTQVRMHTVRFANDLAKKGGAIYMASSGAAGTDCSASFFMCTFAHNRAVNGGAIYSDSVVVTLESNLFLNNSAHPSYYESKEILSRGIGGAVYITNANIAFADYQFHDNDFVNNTAHSKGGAVYWFDTYPTLANNTMAGNWAPYGSEVAAFPIRLALLSGNNTVEDYLSFGLSPLVLTLAGLASGQPYRDSFRLALVDQYSQVVTSDCTSIGSIHPADSEVANVAGAVQVEAIDGVLEFANLTFTGEPKTTQLFIVSSNGIDLFLKEFTSDPNSYYQNVSIAVEFRDCIAGESCQGMVCFLCPEGTFSLKPSQPCEACSMYADCYGGFEMVPKAGYWRPDPENTLFFPCSNYDACLGSPDGLERSLIGLCAEGYSGNLCTICNAGFSKQGRDVCSRCPGLTSNLVVTILVVLGAGCALILIITIAIRGANRPRSQLAIFVKIFMNYLQMIVVAASLNLSWPAMVKLFLSGQEMAGGMAEQLFSFDCLMQEFHPHQLYFAMVQSTAILPGALILLALVFWMLLAVCTKQKNIAQKLVASTVIILFIFHPGLTKVMFSTFSCMEINTREYWLTSDLSQRCWDGFHISQILTVVLPSLCVWVFGLPSLALLFLIRARGRLTEQTTRLKFSFLYSGYVPRRYHWEFVILYRKVALVCSSVFFQVVSTMVQALSVLAVLLICWFLQIHVQPFSSAVFNKLEVKSILVALITIYSGLYFEANTMIGVAGFFRYSSIRSADV